MNKLLLLLLLWLPYHLHADDVFSIDVDNKIDESMLQNNARDKVAVTIPANRCVDKLYASLNPSACRQFLANEEKKKKAEKQKALKDSIKKQKLAKAKAARNKLVRDRARKQAATRKQQEIARKKAIPKVKFSNQYADWFDNWQTEFNVFSVHSYTVDDSYDTDYSGIGILPDASSSYPVDLDRTLLKNTFIRASLTNGVFSENMGVTQAVITNNVFASHGSKLLIPAGSVAYGNYTQLAKVGYTRLMINWSEIITPSGIRILLGEADSVDGNGNSGVGGILNSKLWEKYGTSLLYSAINLSLNRALLDNSTPDNQVIVTQQANQTNEVIKAIIKENINIKPTLSIKASTIINIATNADIWFKPSKQERKVINISRFR